MNPTYVYVIEDEYGNVKIGSAVDIPKRIVDLWCGKSTGSLTCRASFIGTRTDERAIHGYLRAYHLRGEWFAIPADIVTTWARWARESITADEFATRVFWWTEPERGKKLGPVAPHAGWKCNPPVDTVRDVA